MKRKVTGVVVVLMVLALACAGRTPLERGRSFSKEMMDFWWVWAKDCQRIVNSKSYTKEQKQFVAQKIAPKVDEFGDLIDTYNDILAEAHLGKEMSVSKVREEILTLKTDIIRLFMEVSNANSK